MRLDCPPVGPTSAKIVIVGEAPGANEAAKRKPFIGASGKLLKGILASVGIPYSSCYVTNVIKARPSNNDIGEFLNFGRKDPIVKKETEDQLNYFYEEMSQLKPNIIIALGNTPLWALTGERGIQKWRGSIITTDTCWDEPVKLLPTLHPAYCLRIYEGQYLLRFDLIRAVKQSRTKEIPADKYEYIIEPSFEQSLDFLRECGSARRVGVDIEVSRREVSCISFSPTVDDSTKPSGRAISIPFWSPSRGHMCTPPQEAELWKAINRLLRGDNEIIFHNAAFDAVFLFRKYGIQIPKLQDTMVAQAILWPDLPKSLGFTTSLYTEMPYYKEEGKEGLLKGGGTYKEADHQFWIYNAKDAVVLPEIFKGQEEHLHKQSNWRTYTRQRDCIQPIIYMASVGINVNKAAIVEKEASVQKELSALQSQIDTLAKEDGWTGETLNANSPKQLKEYFFAVCGQPITKRRGKVTTDEKALKTITRRGIKGSKTAALIQDFRALKKFSGTYLNMLFDEDGRLRSSINPVGTETGRFSSSQTIFGTGGNMQNMPYSFRVFLEPDPGYVGFEVDLSQAENRIVALLANEDKMLKAFELGMDIHSLTAALIMGKEYEEISDEKGTHPIIPQRSERYLGKQANHASNYDMGANTASLLWGTTIPQTEKIIRGYHKAYPGIRMWHRSVVNHARETGQTITNLMGRSRTYLGRWDKNLHHQMYAFLAQSLVADHINEYGILEMWRERYNEYRGLQLLMQIHDSLLFQANLSLGWPVIATKIRTLCDSLRFPITKGAKGIEIPTNITIYPNNFSEGFEWKDKHPGPTAMKQMYEKMRKTDAKS